MGKDDGSTFEDVKLDFACKNSIETRSKFETVLSIDSEYPTVALVGRDRKRRWWSYMYHTCIMHVFEDSNLISLAKK